MKLRGQLEQLIDTFMLDVASQKEPSTRLPEFRVSSFPYCPLRSLLFSGGRDNSYSMEFYTSIGTAVHESLQKWALKSSFKDKIFCCWKEVKTKKVHGPCFFRDLPKEIRKKELIYEEITIKYKGLSGHVDLVLELLPDVFVIIDFKTTDLQGKRLRHRSKWQDQYPAEHSSIIQISTYSTLLRKLFGLNVKAWCLVYVDRASAIQNSRSYYKLMRPWTKKKSKSMMKHIERACDNNAKLTSLNKIIESSDEYSPKATKLLKYLVKNRPCVDEETYNDWMYYKFKKSFKTGASASTDSSGHCILRKHCQSCSKDAYKAVLSRL
jgi:hypothetical protein